MRKVTATAKQTATEKQHIDLSAINAKIASKQTADKKQNSDSKKQTADSKKQTADSKKQTADNSSVKLSAYRNACVAVSTIADDNKSLYSLQLKAVKNDISANEYKLAEQIAKAIDTDDFHVVFKHTSDCCMFVVDNNKNTVCNVYQCMRIQLTTTQARKYADALHAVASEQLVTAENRFYKHLYKNDTFVSCRCSDFDDFVAMMKRFYTVYMNSKKQTASEQQTAEQTA